MIDRYIGPGYSGEELLPEEAAVVDVEVVPDDVDLAIIAEDPLASIPFAMELVSRNPMAGPRDERASGMA